MNPTFARDKIQANVYKNSEFVVALQRMKAEIESRYPGRSEIPVEEAYALREYAKSRTNLESDDLTAEQAAWKEFYKSLTKRFHEDAPDIIRELENLESVAALERVREEIESRIGEKSELTVHETYHLRDYARSRTNLNSDDLTADQAAWKFMHQSLTDTLRKTAPEMMRKVEPLEKAIQLDELLKNAIESQIEAHPHDQGFRVSYGSLIVGFLIGWLRSTNIWSIFGYGLLGWIAGILFSIFVLNSPYVQCSIAISLNRVGLQRMAHWLYGRGLGW